jgi:HAE1 family hydrophobic/amphiphilic exporter-1
MALFSIADGFIRRPVLATVCTLIILLAGAIAIPLLPINRLPDIAPVQVVTSSTYIGADSETVENLVTTAIERQINGVEGMEYISSSSSNNGVSSISTYFKTGTDKNINQVNVQNRVAIAEPTLPEEVRQVGVTTLSRSSSILEVYGFYSENNEYDSVFLSNYVDLFVYDEIKRLPGVGDVTIVGERKYAMRLWLDPNALASYSLTAGDVSTALQSQNIQVGAGTVGQPPTSKDQRYAFTVRVQGRLKDVNEFENLVLRTTSDGSLVKVKDVGRVELGAQDYTTSALIDGKPGVALLIYQSPGSNALDVASVVEEKMAELEKSFPPGMKTHINYDTTPFVKTSIEEVLQTLLEAVALVVLVIFIFLQDWRATIIPAIAAPVSLIGSLAFALVFGFSLNTLTMFGLVLATGLVVDDAIVVVEGIATKLEQGMNPRQAAFEAMSELSGALVATSLVLIAVFVPVVFFPGATGIMYRQFALIIIFSIAISLFNALTFTPSMSAILLRRQSDSGGRGPLAWFFRQFNRGFGWVLDRYQGLVSFLIRVRFLVLVLFVVGLVLTGLVYRSVPSGFVPEEDQGLFVGIVQAPSGVSLAYTEEIANEVYQVISKVPEVDRTVIIPGFGLNGNGYDQATFFGRLKPWEERKGKDHAAPAIIQRLNGEFAKNDKAIIITVNQPAVPGFSSTGGFEFQLQDRTSGKLSIDEFLQSAQEIIAKANQNPALSRVFTQFNTSTPQLQVDIDRDKLERLNVDYSQAVRTLGAYLGSQYVNDFSFGPRSYRVYVQADQQFRSSPDDIARIYVRSQDNKLIRLSELSTITPISGPQIISHFNLFRTIKIQGNPAPGYSSGQAIQAMEQIFRETAAPGIGFEWTGLSREELSSGGQAGIIFALGIIVVFLVLAAQYENYIDPIIILLVVPLAILGAMSFVSLRHLANDVYCQIALVMLIGLASKNAILIVEFANLSRQQGMSLVQAATHAAQERFRPILMTAAAALVGFYPLVVATGAGAGSRVSIGTAVFGGLLVSTLLSFLLVPVLYVVIKGLAEALLGGGKPPTTPPEHRGIDQPEAEPKPEAAPEFQQAPKFQGESPT